MNKRIIIVLIVIVLIIISIVVIRKNKNSSETRDVQSNYNSIVVDEETNEFVVHDKVTGEEKVRGNVEEGLYIYEVNPDYEPKYPLDGIEIPDYDYSQDLNDFSAINSEDNNVEE